MAALSVAGAKVDLVDAPLALYRRYRPDTFADVIGQDHVTTPLSHALENNRVHHAYLFSGPRGCGKTTSARIMARALNCEKGPTATPCGECDSCVELASGGPGSIDAIEIDAASHNGVDDARDLRERAFFSPVRARYKVYIIDEAHMVTPAAFNALLKLVEEPPDHLRFIFATTEPDKVLGTIRSRTHHYPFRLVPPRLLGDYLVDLCEREGVAIEPTVVPLIVRAGAGSVRDSLSVLDQLMGGAGPEGVTYRLATALLGFTPDSLLDETVDALAAADGATVFGVIDKVVDTGQDPRRFAEDLLHRLRDLVVVSAVPNAASRGLLEVSEDQAERLLNQSARFGRAELTRAGDIVSQGLTDMRGATAPRLLLEMMCARILLPGVDGSAEGFGARLDRIERRLSVVGDVSSPAASPTRTSTGPVTPLGPTTSGDRAGDEAAPADQSPTSREPASATAADSGQIPPASPATASAYPPSSMSPVETTSPPAAAAAQLGLVDVRQLWPGVLERVKKVKRFTWMMLSDNAQVKDVGGGIITIGLANAGVHQNFMRGGHDEILHQALIDELGVDWQVETIIDSSVEPARSARQPPLPAPAETAPGATTEPDHAPTPAPRSADAAAAKDAIRATRSAGASAPAAGEPVDDVLADDDHVVDDNSLSSQELLTRELGARVIEDIRHGDA